MRGGLSDRGAESPAGYVAASVLREDVRRSPHGCASATFGFPKTIPWSTPASDRRKGIAEGPQARRTHPGAEVYRNWFATTTQQRGDHAINAQEFERPIDLACGGVVRHWPASSPRSRFGARLDGVARCTSGARSAFSSVPLPIASTRGKPAWHDLGERHGLDRARRGLADSTGGLGRRSLVTMISASRVPLSRVRMMMVCRPGFRRQRFSPAGVSHVQSPNADPGTLHCISSAPSSEK